MKVTIIGKGLIGGSLEKAAIRVGHEVSISGRAPKPDVGTSDLVFFAVPPNVVVPLVKALASEFKPGAVVVDVTGIKSGICRELEPVARDSQFTFVGGHPMAGKEKTGYANSTPDLFRGASMILTPYPNCPEAVLDTLSRFLAEIGFARIIRTDPRHHDEMIAFTSQLCHLISSAYVRDGLAKQHVGYSAGSFRDMARVGAPDPDIWTELFFSNREHLLPALERYIARLENFRTALAENDRVRLHADLEEGVAAKKTFEGGLE